ncbi:MAG: TIGR00266 family protein [Epulopiscium sp. Nele67-Bin005]|nr:MAG: TIGR00266 family protein [Epulopiscium sp. Nele67-Bin005]
MQYEIFGETIPGVTIKLEDGESVYSQSGQMVWCDDYINMNTGASHGGFFKSIGRLFTGESLFVVNFEARKDMAEVTFASSFPGEILAVEISGGDEIIVEKSAFLCAEQSIETSVAFTKKISAGLFGGEGFILQKISGDGTVFLEVAGNIVEKELDDGEILRVDTGNVVGFESTVSYEVEMVRGIKNMIFGGEGVFLTKLQGPGRVWLQTATMQNIAERIVPFIPTPNQ